MFDSRDAIGTSILIRYDGLDAEAHEIELAALAESLRGLARIIAVTGNFAATGRYVQHKDALDVRVVVGTPQAHCFELWAFVRWAGEHPLIATTVGGLTVALITYIFKRAAGQREEMRQLRGALDEAIKQLGERDKDTVDRLLTTIDKMADALRPAARQAVAPLGRTAASLTVGLAETREQDVTLSEVDREAILAEGPIEIGEEADFELLITELDMETGSCRVCTVAEPENRFSGRITDPVFTMPNNPYVTAMAAKRAIWIRGKMTFKDGMTDKVFISDYLPRR